MKIAVFLFLLFYSNRLYAEIPTENVVRHLFEKAVEDENACKKLIVLLEPFNENNNALFAGYKACGTMMMAKFVFNPFTKLTHFYTGKNLLENAIVSDKNNIELRFLRFTIQTNAPAFLNYKNSIKEDKLFLLNSFYKISNIDFKQLIIRYLKNSEYLTNLEKQKIYNERISDSCR